MGLMVLMVWGYVRKFGVDASSKKDKKKVRHLQSMHHYELAAHLNLFERPREIRTPLRCLLVLSQNKVAKVGGWEELCDAAAVTAQPLASLIR